jgi:hypothetical protein
VSEDKKVHPASTYTFSFSVTRSGAGLAPGVRVLEYAKVLPTRDILLLVGAVLLFLVEPAALYWAFSRAPAEAAAAHAAAVSEARAPADRPVAEKSQDAAAPGGPPGEDSDLITPLNARDPSALVLRPYPDPEPAPTPAPEPAPERSKGRQR